MGEDRKSIETENMMGGFSTDTKNAFMLLFQILMSMQC